MPPLFILLSAACLSAQAITPCPASLLPPLPPLLPPLLPLLLRLVQTNASAPCRGPRARRAVPAAGRHPPGLGQGGVRGGQEGVRGGRGDRAAQAARHHGHHRCIHVQGRVSELPVALRARRRPGSVDICVMVTARGTREVSTACGVLSMSFLHTCYNTVLKTQCHCLRMRMLHISPLLESTLLA